MDEKVVKIERLMVWLRNFIFVEWAYASVIGVSTTPLGTGTTS
jgi:hypothetical protein